MKRSVSPPLAILASVLLIAFFSLPLRAWNNGPQGDALTDESHPSCDIVPYGTHDWIADRARALLPSEERAWLDKHLKLFLLGTEAPDSNKIPQACGAPESGYKDSARHNVYWNADYTEFCAGADDAAALAQKRFEQALEVLKVGQEAQAAYYAGAMAHYIADVAQFGHVSDNTACGNENFDEKHHSDYEDFVEKQIDQFESPLFGPYIVYDGGFISLNAYEAVVAVSKITAQGGGKTKPAGWMDQSYNPQDPEFMNSVGDSLNRAVNALADVLHTLYVQAKTQASQPSNSTSQAAVGAVLLVAVMGLVLAILLIVGLRR